MRWQRIYPGYYASGDDRWIISREERSLYSIRVLVRWGSDCNGGLCPDAGRIWYGDYATLAEAKAAVEALGDWLPSDDPDLRLEQINREYATEGEQA